MCCWMSSHFRNRVNPVRAGSGTGNGAFMTVGSPNSILAIDIGAGTQDVLVYDPDRTPENCFRLVMPSQTQVVGSRIRDVTKAAKPIAPDWHGHGWWRLH